MMKQRLFYCHLSLVKKLTKHQKIRKIWSRSSLIIPEMLNKTYFIHNGKVFIKTKIDVIKVFSKLGDYAKTRQDFSFPEKKIIKKK